MIIGLEKAVFSARDVVAMGLEKSDFCEKRDGYVSENALAVGLERAMFSAKDATAIGLEMRWLFV